MSMSMYWPIVLILVSNIFYHICAKSTPEGLNPFVSLTVTYLVGAVVSMLCFFVLGRDTSLSQELSKFNYTPFVLGIAIVGLEVGCIYLYRVGWSVNTGYLVQSVFIAIALVFVGWLGYHESFSLSKVIGMVCCLVGLFFMNR